MYIRANLFLSLLFLSPLLTRSGTSDILVFGDAVEYNDLAALGVFCLRAKKFSHEAMSQYIESKHIAIKALPQVIKRCENAFAIFRHYSIMLRLNVGLSLRRGNHE